MSETINIGDRVSVFFERCEAEINVKVVNIPGGTGDSWALQRMDGTLVYVQTFSKIVRTLEIKEPAGVERKKGPIIAPREIQSDAGKMAPHNKESTSPFKDDSL